jgi:hypothetical protein
MPQSRLKLTVSAALLCSLPIISGCQSASDAGPGHGVAVREDSGKVHVEINGSAFTDYYYKDVPRPYCYPLLGPDGLEMTRHWPMETKGEEEHDHKHHRSFWFAHGAVNGQDLWSEEPKSGRTVHQGFLKLESGREKGVIQSTNLWVSVDGKPLCSDVRTLTIYDRSPEKVFDFEITLYASQGDVTFGDTKEGTMALRLAETMRLTGKTGHGHILNSEGVRDGATWGKRADWVEYHGPVNGVEVGAAILDSPSNPRHPTWWHVRDYGLFAANPFGLHDFEKKPAHTGDFLLPAGKTVTFRYRFILHRGDETEGRVAAEYKAYSEGKAPLASPR